MISALSGTGLIGLSGLISGYRTTGSGLQIGISGYVTEAGFGAYYCHLYDWDVSGAIVSYLFTGASGAIPVEKTVVTTFNISGNIYTASGIWPASGANVNASINAGSGLFVTVPTSTISGVVPFISAAALSGAFSGNIVIVGGVTSGVFSGQQVTLTSGQSYIASGINVVGTFSLASGALSGQQVTLVSGQSYIASGANTVVPPSTLSGVTANSGLFVSVPTSSISGTTVTANVTLWQGVSPNPLISSGRLDAAFNVRTNVARSGTTTTIQLDAGVPTGISGVYDNQTLTIVGGTGTGRSRTILNMGSSGIAFINPAWDASGVPDTTSIFTITPGSHTFSGLIQIASGANTVVPPGTLSGVTVNSGLFVTVPIATISGVIANSGLFVTVPVATISGIFPASGSLSGQQVTLVSGQSYTASGIWPASGAFTTASVGSGAFVVATVLSGTLSGQPIAGLSGFIYPASGVNVVGTFSLASGSLSGQQVTLVSGQSYPASGVYTNSPAGSAASGLYVIATVLSGNLSGQPIAGLSGFIYPASGINVVGSFSLASGALSGQQVTLVSGQSYPASGVYTNSPAGSAASGLYVIATVLSGNLSGQPVAGLSGFIYPASGIYTNSPAGSAGSGLFVTVPINTISGVNAVVLPATLSGVVANSGLFVTANLQSGQVYLASGSQVLIQSGQLSGQQVNLLSGNQVQVWSGTQVNTFSGFTYPASGVYTIAPIASGSLSGQQVITLTNLDKTNYGVTSIASGILSGQQVTLTSGQSYTASGIWPASGAAVTGATITSGQVFLASGTQVLVYSGQLSGQVNTTILSGQVWIASGTPVLVYSGQLSGFTVNATAVVSSGTSVVLQPNSIQASTFASGVLTYEIPNDLLNFDYSGAASGPVHTLLNATRKLINRWDVTSASGYLTVYREDANTTAYQQAIGVQTSGANPIVSLGDS